jgi:hypothetical protein
MILPVHNLAIMLPSSLRALPPVGESYVYPFIISPSLPSSFWPLLVHNLAIMLPSSLRALPPVVGNLTIYLHDLPIMLPSSLFGSSACWQTLRCPFMISPSCCRRGFGFFRLLELRSLPGSTQTPFNLSVNSTTFTSVAVS